MEEKRKNLFKLTRIALVAFLATLFLFNGFCLENERENLSVYAQDFSPNYPRLFNMYLRNDLSDAGIIEALKNWDHVALSNRAPASDVNRLKAANPNIKIGRYFTPVSITNNASEFSWSYDKDLYNKISTSNWWMRDVEGGNIVTFGSRTDQYYSLGINFTRYAPTDASGQRFYDWFPQYVYDRIVRGMTADFLFADETYSGYNWLNNANDNKPIDIDNDGVADSNEKIDEATAEGIRLIMTKLRQLLNAGGFSNMVIVANGIQPASPYANYFNGTMREAFPFMHGVADPSPNPYGYHWKDNMFNQNYGYLATEKAMVSPNFSLIGGDSGYTSGQDPINPPSNPSFQQKVRFMLGSTLLGDGYFGFAGWWNIAWWISDYFTFRDQKGYLGVPEGSYSQVITETKQGSNYGVYQRLFTNGLVLVNASGYKQNVALTSSYKKVPDGSIISGTIEIPAWDAIILVKSESMPSQEKHGLAIYLRGASGVITSDPEGINCGDDCSEYYPKGTRVTLTASPSSGSTFLGWDYDCSGSSPTCTVIMDKDLSVKAVFGSNPNYSSASRHILAIYLRGASGVVTSSYGGINCGSSVNDCSQDYPDGATMTLTATPYSGSVFLGWDYDCSGSSPTCTVTMNKDLSVKAVFGSISAAQSLLPTLRVYKYGTGGGTVVSILTGIDCGFDCSEGYAIGDKPLLIKLIALPNNDSIFQGWSGVCRGLNTCFVAMKNTNLPVGATFEKSSLWKSSPLSKSQTKKEGKKGNWLLDLLKSLLPKKK